MIDPSESLPLDPPEAPGRPELQLRLGRLTHDLQNAQTILFAALDRLSRAADPDLERQLNGAIDKVSGVAERIMALRAVIRATPTPDLSERANKLSQALPSLVPLAEVMPERLTPGLEVAEFDSLLLAAHVAARAFGGIEDVERSTRNVDARRPHEMVFVVTFGSAESLDHPAWKDLEAATLRLAGTFNRMGPQGVEMAFPGFPRAR